MAAESKKNHVKNSILSRIGLLYVFFAAICIAILIMIVWIQLGSDSQQHKVQSVQYSYRSEIIPAQRGNILSSDGRILSTTIPTYELRMDMQANGLKDSIFRDNVDRLSAQLSSFFKDKSQAQYAKELRDAHKQKKRYHLVTRKRINYLELQRVKKFPLFCLGPNKGGFMAIEQGKRMLPHGELASRVIGFTNSTGTKVGLEGGFDNRLRGIDGNTIKQKISGNFWIPISSPLNIEAQAGLDIVTTIDIELQDIAQTALRERLSEVNGQWGTVIVMEVETGYIRAMANATRNASTGKITEDYNYALGMSMEPGSTFKIAGLLALIDEGGMSLNEMVDTEGGSVYIGKAKVVDTRSGGYGRIPMVEAFEFSSNIGMAKAVNKYFGSNPNKFIDYLCKLQLNKPLGFQIAGEAKPIVRRPKDKGWDGTTLTMMSYGYAVRVTPMQTLTFCNAIANNGRMVKPQLVKELLQYGEVVEEFKPITMVDAIASPHSIREVQRAMTGVVERGTGKALRNPNYKVAAKTGTAQVAMGRSGYRANGGRTYLGSIVGYFPADNPKYTIMIAMQKFHRDGSNEVYYGGALTSPLFRTIADLIYTTKYDFLKPLPTTERTIDPELRIKKGNSSVAHQSLSNMGFRSSVQYIENYSPNYWKDSKKKSQPKDSLINPQSQPSTKHLEQELNTKLQGYALSDAVKYLEAEGLRVAASGRGAVKVLSIDSSSMQKYGVATAKLTLEP